MKIQDHVYARHPMGKYMNPSFVISQPGAQINK